MANLLVSRRRALAMLLSPIAALAARSVPGTMAAPGPTSTGVLERETSASGYCTDSQEARFLALINDYRAKNGLNKLALSRTLGAAAEHHSKDMARYNYFSHTLRGGVSWSSNIKKHGYKASGTMAENIAAGNSSADDTFRQWRNSAGHNKNMLNPSFRAIGIGRASKSSSKYRWYWTTTFGGAQDSGAGRC
ncbi:MAG: CAP domain-containing protein [Thermomicrobiales bacterium]|nr:CAP domain-containing protein [Thermomicrobiales bacterium]